MSGTPGRRTKRRKSKTMHFEEFWDSCGQNRTPEISTNELSRIMGLLCAEQNGGNLQNLALRSPGTPVRRTKRQNSQQMHVYKFWDSCAQSKALEISKGVNFVLVLNQVHVLALNTAHVLRLNKADVLALNKAHVLRLNTKICPVFTATTKEAARIKMWECKRN